MSLGRTRGYIIGLGNMARVAICGAGEAITFGPFPVWVVESFLAPKLTLMRYCWTPTLHVSKSNAQQLGCALRNPSPVGIKITRLLHSANMQALNAAYIQPHRVASETHVALGGGADR